MHLVSSISFGLLLTGIAAAASAQAPSATMKPPEGTAPIGTYPAHGVQIYTCTKKDGAEAAAWVLKAPEAELVGTDGKLFAKHSAGPTWTANDGSTVTGKLLNKQAAPQPDAIDWLLLSATSKGDGVLAGTRFVQRVATKGGKAPGGSCSPGQETRVPYSADYVFYR